MAEADTLQHRLLEAQNSDGGWGYQNGTSRTGPSWTEPTALALLALTGKDESGAACRLGQSWLRLSQKRDGGWAPQPAVGQSTWVTSLATMALEGVAPAEKQYRQGVFWLVRQIQPADDPIAHFIGRLRGTAFDSRPAGGSAWFPGTAAWVGPSAMSVLALTNEAARSGDSHLRSYVREAQQFILSRRCSDGGWNHGGAKYRSQNASSYPEMTGMALLALRGVEKSELLFPLERAVAFVRSPTSSEALSWLELGLAAHGRSVGAETAALPCRTVRDIALRLLALTGPSSTNRLLPA